MGEAFLVVKAVRAVRTKADGSAIALEVDTDTQGPLTLEVPAERVHTLMRELLAAVSHLPPESPAAEGAQQAFTVTGYGVGLGFPESVVLALRTAAFGQQGFGLDPDTARRVARELERHADQLESRGPAPH